MYHLLDMSLVEVTMPILPRKCIINNDNCSGGLGTRLSNNLVIMIVLQGQSHTEEEQQMLLTNVQKPQMGE